MKKVLHAATIVVAFLLTACLSLTGCTTETSARADHSQVKLSREADSVAKIPDKKPVVDKLPAVVSSAKQNDPRVVKMIELIIGKKIKISETVRTRPGRNKHSMLYDFIDVTCYDLIRLSQTVRRDESCIDAGLKFDVNLIRVKGPKWDRETGDYKSNFVAILFYKDIERIAAKHTDYASRKSSDDPGLMSDAEKLYDTIRMDVVDYFANFIVSRDNRPMESIANGKTELGVMIFNSRSIRTLKESFSSSVDISK